MTPESYKTELANLRTEAKAKEHELIKQFAFENSPYKIGDIFTDRLGSIRIEKILATIASLNRDSLPSCIYIGVELKKDLTNKKGDPKRNAYQSNEIKN